MERDEELRQIFKDCDALPLISTTINEIVYMESKLKEYKASLQGISLTAKTKDQYKFYNGLYLDTLAKYNTAVQTLLRIVGKEETEAESPLRAFLNGLETR